MQCILLCGLVADPDTAELPLHMLAVEHVPEEHLVAGECLPAKRDRSGTLARQPVLLTICRMAPTDSKSNPAFSSVRLSKQAVLTPTHTCTELKKQLSFLNTTRG